MHYSRSLHGAGCPVFRYSGQDTACGRNGGNRYATRFDEIQTDAQAERFDDFFQRFQCRVLVRVFELGDLLLADTRSPTECGLRPAGCIARPADLKSRREARPHVDPRKLSPLGGACACSSPRRNLTVDQVRFEPALKGFLRGCRELVAGIRERLATGTIGKLSEHVPLLRRKSQPAG